MAGEGRTWRTWQLLVVAAVALVIGITAGASTKPKTTAVSAGTTLPIIQATEKPTSPPTTAKAPATTAAPAPTSPPTSAGPKTTFAGDGTYIVGKDIAPGTYRTAGPKQSGSLGLCYWERESDLSGSFGGIIANENLKGPGVVTIAATDKGFKTSGCQEWSQA